MRRLLLLLTVPLAVVAGTAAPAFAHGGGGPDATNFKSTIQRIGPAGGGSGAAPEGVKARIIANDALIEIANRGKDELTVIGYSDEPYLRIGPKGVFRNLNSPATYINQNRYAAVEVPPDISASDPPKWEKVKDEPVYAWHDHRIHWMSQTTPPQVIADLKSPVVKIYEWAVPLKAGDKSYEVDGVLNWIRPKSPMPWLLGGLLVTSLPVAYGRMSKPKGEERKRALKQSFAVMLGILVILDVIHSIDDILAVPATLAQNVSATAQSALFIAIGAYGARVAYKAGSGAWVGVLLGAFGLALGIGATHLISLTSSQIASKLPEAYTRAVVAASAMSLVPAGFIAWRVHEPVLVETVSTKDK